MMPRGGDRLLEARGQRWIPVPVGPADGEPGEPRQGHEHDGGAGEPVR